MITQCTVYVETDVILAGVVLLREGGSVGPGYGSGTRNSPRMTGRGA